MQSEGRPRVTIGVPVYNGERFLAETLDSLLSQTFRDFELIISDNASTDRTRDICRAYAARDRRVRYCPNTLNRGAAWNHNRLVELATGTYFKWAMADDLCERDLVERCVDVLDSDPGVVLACFRTTFIDHVGKTIRRLDPGWNLSSEMPHERLRTVIYAGGHWANADALAGVIRLAALRRTTLLPKYQGGDKRPLAELSLIGRFVEIPEYSYLRRLHPSASSSNNPGFSKNKTESIAWMMRFFKGSKLQVSLPTWNLLRDYAVLIGAAKLPLGRKATLLNALLRSILWNKKCLLSEITNAAALILKPVISQR